MTQHAVYVHDKGKQLLTYLSASRTQKESMKGKFPAMASNSSCEINPSLS